ncbi:MAG TPA: c-type cytochrome [Terracidiphilus sp.]|jgi:mono/diheme cytochrome c family protein|nr:c-type cytochrome [Terracidiphilus sp.]
MLKHLLLTALAAACTAGVGYAADQSTGKITIPVERTSPISGKQMFTSYCAPCHGVDGKGRGPAASALKDQPTDLTGLAKKNHGRFPDTHIVTVLQFGSALPSHGSAEMPVWGPILGKMNVANAQDKQLRISNLSRYIDSIQER